MRIAGVYECLCEEIVFKVKRPEARPVTISPISPLQYSFVSFLVEQELKTHQAGNINATHSLQITADSVRNTSGAVMYSGGDMDIEAKSVLNRGL